MEVYRYHGTFGFKIGSSDNNLLYIQTITENSITYESGIQPNMQVLKIGMLNFLDNHNYCDYVNYMENTLNTISIELSDSDGRIKTISLRKRVLLSLPANK